MKVVRMPKLFLMIIMLIITSARMFAAVAQPTVAETSRIEEGVSAEVKEAFAIGSFSELATWFALPTFSKGLPAKGALYNVVASKFGNKTVNLCVLTVLADTVNKEVLQDSGYTMAVPAFTAISHDVIAAYLDQVMGLSKLWVDFQTKQDKSSNLQEKAAAVLAEIRAGIRKAFSDKAPEYIQRLFEPFLKQNVGRLLMVRSTSLEDRVDMANAGGNESKSSVQPIPAAVWQAIGEVVESYFSEKSIKQRLLAGDNVTARYFIPVLIQCMIGENAWRNENPATLEAIPVSGVMFTELGDTTGSQVVQIQSAYGHNQGVVNSLVSVDTFYIGSSEVIYPVIRKKEQRLVTVGTELQAKENYLFDTTTAKKDYAMQTAPSLTPAIIRVLKQIADRVHKIYDHAMDIEFVVQGKVVYLVQARPLIHRVETKAPSYLSDALVGSVYGEKEVKAAATGKDAVEGKEAKTSKLAEASKAAAVTKAATVFTGSSVGVAGGYVRVINDPAQVIIRDDIGQALDAYHANAKRNKVLVILIKKTAPSTSHEATQFRSYGKPVMVFAADRLQAIDQILNNFGGKSLLVDPQRGTVVAMPDALDEKSAAPFVVQGWYTHPIPLMVSVVQGFYLSPNSALGKTIATYTETLRWDPTEDEDDGKKPMRQVLAEVKSPHARENLIENLKLIMHRLAGLAQQCGSFESLQWESTWLVGAASVFASDVLYTFDQLKTSEAKEPEKRLAYLYPIKFLEALILQQPDLDVVDGFSYVLLRKAAKEDREKLVGLLQLQGEAIKKADPKMLEYAVQCMKVNTIALNDGLRNNWTMFIKGLVSPLLQEDEQELSKYGKSVRRLLYNTTITKLASLINQLAGLGILEGWLHTSFVDAWGKSSAAKAPSLACAKRLIEEIEGKPEGKAEKEGKEAREEKKEAAASSKEIIAWVAEQMQMVAACERRINEWSSPEQFKALFKQFGIIHDLCVPQGTEKEFAAMMFADEKASEIRFIDAMDDFGGKKRAAFYQELKAYEQKSSPFVRRFNQAGRLGRLALISLFKKTIDVFDRTIKSMTGSPQYSDKNVLAKNFATLLTYYLALMEQLLTLIPVEQEPLLMRIVPSNPSQSWPFANYVSKMRGQFNACYSLAQQGGGRALLQKTQGFGVMAAQIGSRSAFDRTLPKTLEDCFMLMHQNMLMTTVVLNKEYGMSLEQLPPLVQHLDAVMKEMFRYHTSPRQVSVVGIDYKYPNLSVDYNLPLRNHSAMFNVTWNGQKSPRKVTLAAHFLGHNKSNRMHALCGYANIVTVALGIGFDQIPRTTAPLDVGSRLIENRAWHTDFAWVVNDDTDLEAVGKCLEFMADSMELASSFYVASIGDMIKDIDKITHHFFKQTSTSGVEKAVNDFENATGDARKKLALVIFNALPTLPDSFFTNVLLCNDWFIGVYMAAEQYAQALRVIELSLGVIISQGMFGYQRQTYDEALLLNYCLQELCRLVEKKAVPESYVQGVLARLKAVRGKGGLDRENLQILNDEISAFAEALEGKSVVQEP